MSPYESVLDEVESDLKRNYDSPETDVESFLEARLIRLRAVPLAMHRARKAKLFIDVANQYYLHAQKIFRAVEPIAMAVMLAEQEGDKQALRKATNIQGLILGATSNVTDAIRSFMRSLDLAEELGEPYFVVATWINIGIAFLDTTLFADARASFERAITMASRLPESLAVRYAAAKALHGSAICSLRLNEYLRGLESVEEALSLLEAPQDRDQEQTRVLVEATYVRLLLATNRVDEAIKRTDIAEPMAERSGSVRATLAASTTRGLVEVYSGRTDLGLSRIASAVQLARSLPGSLYETLQVAVMTHERAGHDERAEAAHRALITHVRNMRIANITRNAGLPLSSPAGIHEGRGSSVPASLYEPLRQRFNTLIARPVPGSAGRRVGVESRGQVTGAPSVAERFRPFGWQPWKT